MSPAPGASDGLQTAGLHPGACHERAFTGAGESTQEPGIYSGLGKSGTATKAAPMKRANMSIPGGRVTRVQVELRLPSRRECGAKIGFLQKPVGHLSFKIVGMLPKKVFFGRQVDVAN